MNYNIRNEFLQAIEQSYEAYNQHGARSNKKLKPIHKWLGEAIVSGLGAEYDYRCISKGGEQEIEGKYYNKKSKKNPVAWYAFGRSQGLDTSWGKKILVSPLSIKPNFIVWEKEDYTFYAGYCIKFDGDLHWLAEQLNSKDMEFFIKYVGRDYQNGYKSYAKSFISKFGIVGLNKDKELKLF